jgi:CheY-like chemotaxis protein
MATVLVVDDDLGITAVLEAALADAGYAVLTAGDGAAALQVARDRHPDVILLDVMMPVMDGVEATRRLRADPSTAAIPIIALSAAHRLASLAGQMPVDDRLPKPFDLATLYATVGRWAPSA